MPDSSPFVAWSGRDFTMKPGHPISSRNPCTRCLNLVIGSDGALYRRRSFAAAPSGTPQNHIVAELSGQSYLIIKDGTSVKYSTGGSFTAITMATLDPPINSGAADATSRGSFALHAGEVYYCDKNTIFAWDGLNAGRRPGVSGLQGLVYNGTGGEALPGGPLTATTDAQFLAIPSPNPIHPALNPGIIPAIPSAADKVGFLAKGEKTLNCAFALGYYDVKRKIYGRRCEAFAYPFIFGPPDPDGSNIVLTDERTQYAKVISVPTSPNHPEYKIAVWFSLGQNLVTNSKATVQTGLFFYFNEAVPMMSKRMTGTLFLEAIVDPGSTGVVCTKDNATLAASGRYIDAYERPVPAMFMAILSNGVAIYFFPWTTTPELGGTPSSLGNHALYSVNHPEQVGLNTETQRDTTSLMPNLNGTPMAILSDGDTQFLLTNQAVYGIGFDGGVALQEVSKRGLRALGSIADSTVGKFWFADEGVCWLRGGQMILLDEKLGFSEWFSNLNPTQKANVVIGAADGMKQVLVFSEDLDNGTPHAMVYDYERDFVSEFNGEPAPRYAANFRSATKSQLFLFGSGVYPGDTYTNEESSVTLWLNEQLEIPKTLGYVVVDLGPRSGSVTVSVEPHQAGEDTESNAPYTGTKSFTIVTSGDGSGRFAVGEFQGMRARMFKIKVTGPNGLWSLIKVCAYYTPDQGSNAGSI